MASVTTLSGGIASMNVARAAGAGVSRRAVVAHVGAGNGDTIGFGASALLGKDTSPRVDLGDTDYGRPTEQFRHPCSSPRLSRKATTPIN